MSEYEWKMAFQFAVSLSIAVGLGTLTYKLIKRGITHA